MDNQSANSSIQLSGQHRQQNLIQNFARQASLNRQDLNMILKQLEDQPVRRTTRGIKKEPETSKSNLSPLIKTSQESKIKEIILRTKKQKPSFEQSKELSFSKQDQTPQTPKKEPKPHHLKTPKRHNHSHTPKKPAIPIPNSVDEFFQSYFSYSTIIFKQTHQNQMKFVQKQKQNLYNLLKKVIQFNGIASVISQGYKDQVFEQFINKFPSSQTTQKIFSIYKKYLFHFQYYLLENYQFKDYKEATNIFQQATFVSEQELREFLQHTPLDPKYFQYDILVFRNGQSVLAVNPDEISLDKVADCYKEYNIDIRIQKGMDYGFKPKTLRNQPYKMQVQKYRLYQKVCQQYKQQAKDLDEEFFNKLGKLKDLDVNGQKLHQRIRDKQILFGVNFDPDDGILVDHIARTVKGSFLGYKEQFDLLSYLDHQIPGCSFPQFYFKVTGVWTGGHQENVNMCAVNINHGPDSSQWYTMEYKYVEQFRAQLKKEHKMDLYGSQGLWYQKINWFVEQGKYPIKKIIQKKGDIVISGPGTLHWVRSHGIALQSAWNLFPITYNSLLYAYNRQQENQRIKFIRANTIPLKSLTLKFLNHQSKYLTKKISQLCVSKLKMWYQNQKQLYEKLLTNDYQGLGNKPVIQQPLDDLQGFCSFCKTEVLIYFTSGKTDGDIVCLKCFSQSERLKKRNKNIYMRHSPYSVQCLIQFTQSGQKFQQIPSFCNGPYVGKVPIKCASNRCQTFKSQELTRKLNKVVMDLNDLNEQGYQKIKEDHQRKRQLKLQKQQEESKQIQEQMQSQTLKKLSQKQQLEKMELENNIQMNNENKLGLNTKQDTLVDGVILVGDKPTSKFWWNFRIPQKYDIITQKNFQQIVELLYKRWQYHVQRTNQQGTRYNWQQYFIMKSNKFNKDFKSNNYGTSNYSRDNYIRRNKHDQIDPKFSQDQDEKDLNKHGNKKIHQNEELPQENSKINKMQLENQNKSYQEKSKRRTDDLKQRGNKQSRHRHRSNSSKSSKSSKASHKAKRQEKNYRIKEQKRSKRSKSKSSRASSKKSRSKQKKRQKRQQRDRNQNGSSRRHDNNSEKYDRNKNQDKYYNSTSNSYHDNNSSSHRKNYYDKDRDYNKNRNNDSYRSRQNSNQESNYNNPDNRQDYKKSYENSNYRNDFNKGYRSSQQGYRQNDRHEGKNDRNSYNDRNRNNSYHKSRQFEGASNQKQQTQQKIQIQEY